MPAEALDIIRNYEYNREHKTLKKIKYSYLEISTVLSYQRFKHHHRALRTFTGLDQAEFEKLLLHFEMAYHAYMYDQHVTKKSRKRRYGAGKRSQGVKFISP